VKKMQILTSTKKLLREYGVRPRKKLGQSFMVDEKLMLRMMDYAELKSTDTVLEIGAGLGFLTELLAEKAGKILAIELDRKLIKILNEKLAFNEKIEIIQGDFLKLKINGYNKVISNPPYSLSSNILFKILESPLECAVLTLQSEFAERLVANPGDESYGRLTVMAFVKSEVELMENVPRTAFFPIPEVSSKVVKIKPKKIELSIPNWHIFEETVRILFTQRNRKLKNALEVFGKVKKIENFKPIIQNIPFLERRVFTLTPEEFGVVANEIWERTQRVRISKSKAYSA
jgi:16S rRNA (adenine1518-N6/adenine1519-N6)-dimethyltransferase